MCGILQSAKGQQTCRSQLFCAVRAPCVKVRTSADHIGADFLRDGYCRSSVSCRCAAWIAKFVSTHSAARGTEAAATIVW